MGSYGHFPLTIKDEKNTRPLRIPSRPRFAFFKSSTLLNNRDELTGKFETERLFFLSFFLLCSRTDDVQLEYLKLMSKLVKFGILRDFARITKSSDNRRLG